jgi:hypothetical protein
MLYAVFGQAMLANGGKKAVVDCMEGKKFGVIFFKYCYVT